MADDWKEVLVDWVNEGHFIGKNDAGGTVHIGSYDGNPGVAPMEMLLLGVAGCTGVDVINILNKKRQKPERFRVCVRGKRADQHPKVYTEIEIIYLVWGKELKPKDLEDAIHLSKDKYCSASVMMAATAKIAWRYEINPTTNP